jgi:hypothetical protein
MTGEPRVAESLLRAAFIAGVAHAAAVTAFAAVVAGLAWCGVAQWQLSWTYLEALDWPVSLLYRWGGWPQAPIAWLPPPFRAPRAFILPLAMSGLLGTLWYALLGGVVGALRILLGRGSRRTTRCS